MYCTSSKYCTYCTDLLHLLYPPLSWKVGLDAAVLIDGNPDKLTLKVGLNACVDVGKKTFCASEIPLLDKYLPLYLLSGTYSFGHICNGTVPDNSTVVPL